MTQAPSFGLAGIIGMPVAHSRSPIIHNHWLAEHGLPGRYVLLPVQPERLADALKGLVALGFRALSLTPSALGAVKAMLLELDAKKAEDVLRSLMESPPKDAPIRKKLEEFAAAEGLPL